MTLLETLLLLLRQISQTPYSPALSSKQVYLDAPIKRPRGRETKFVHRFGVLGWTGCAVEDSYLCLIAQCEGHQAKDEQPKCTGYHKWEARKRFERTPSMNVNQARSSKLASVGSNGRLFGVNRVCTRLAH